MRVAQQARCQATPPWSGEGVPAVLKVIILVNGFWYFILLYTFLDVAIDLIAPSLHQCSRKFGA